MPALAVAAHEQELVPDIVPGAAPGVEVRDVLLEALPLGLCALGVEAGVRRVRPVQEPEIHRGLTRK